MSGDGGTDGNAGIDTGIPNVARVYDYLLGGTDNYPADRALGDQLRTALPDSVLIAQNNRAFLGRAVRYCAEQGSPSSSMWAAACRPVGNVHEVVRMVAPGATVVYVDIDRTAIAHANALLAVTEGVAAIQGDAREPERILADVTALGLLDLSRPVAVVLAAIFHFITFTDRTSECPCRSPEPGCRAS